MPRYRYGKLSVQLERQILAKRSRLEAFLTFVKLISVFAAFWVLTYATLKFTFKL